MKSKLGSAAAATLAAAAVAATAAGAGAQQPAVTRTAAVGAAAAAQVNLSTAAGVRTYLRSLGLDPASVVVQRGQRNYAGPKCPGRGWTCTTAARVLQVARGDDEDDDDEGGGSNRFECTPSSGGSATPPNSCVIVQSSTGGKNEARCRESSSLSPVAQSCVITQTNSSGRNRAVAEQEIDQRGAFVQEASQSASVTQNNGSGANEAEIEQTILQDTKTKGKPASVVQVQDTTQTVEVDQETSSGSNSSDVDQAFEQEASATSDGSVSQRQNAAASAFTEDDEPDERDISAIVDQVSASGRNVSELEQTADQSASVKGKGGAVVQRQGDFDGGLLGDVEQTSAGISKSEAQQTERQTLSSKKAVSVDQTQIGPLDCCTTQTGNPANRTEIKQSSEQRADAGSGSDQSDEVNAACATSGNCDIDQSIRQRSGGGGEQNAIARADCTAAGNCQVEQEVSNDTDSESNSESGQSVFTVTGCTSGGEGSGGCFAGGGPD